MLTRAILLGRKGASRSLADLRLAVCQPPKTGTNPSCETCSEVDVRGREWVCVRFVTPIHGDPVACRIARGLDGACGVAGKFHRLSTALSDVVGHPSRPCATCRHYAFDSSEAPLGLPAAHRCFRAEFAEDDGHPGNCSALRNGGGACGPSGDGFEAVLPASFRIEG